MNPTELTELSDADLAFAMKARAALRASESLNYVESAKLAATRAKARELLGARQGLPGWAWLAAPASAAAVIAVLAMRSMPGEAPTVAAPPAEMLAAVTADIAVNVAAPEALMWVSDEAGPDFYRDLAFYEWLNSRPPSKPNA